MTTDVLPIMMTEQELTDAKKAFANLARSALTGSRLSNDELYTRLRVVEMAIAILAQVKATPVPEAEKARQAVIDAKPVPKIAGVKSPAEIAAAKAATTLKIDGVAPQNLPPPPTVQPKAAS